MGKMLSCGAAPPPPPPLNRLASPPAGRAPGIGASPTCRRGRRQPAESGGGQLRAGAAEPAEPVQVSTARPCSLLDSAATAHTSNTHLTLPCPCLAGTRCRRTEGCRRRCRQTAHAWALAATALRQTSRHPTLPPPHCPAPRRSATRPCTPLASPVRHPAACQQGSLAPHLQPAPASLPSSSAPWRRSCSSWRLGLPRRAASPQRRPPLMHSSSSPTRPPRCSQPPPLATLPCRQRPHPPLNRPLLPLQRPTCARCSTSWRRCCSGCRQQSSGCRRRLRRERLPRPPHA